MKNILIITDIYPPEVSSAAHIMQELAEGLQKQGHKVWVLTSYPRHYLPTEMQGKSFSIYSQERGINIIRAKTLPLRKVNFFIRGLSQLLLPLIFFFYAKKFIKEKLDVVFVFSPPLPLALAGSMIKKSYKAQFILMVGDIFPQNAVDLGVLYGWRHKPAVLLFEAIERKAYRAADALTFHSDTGRQYLIDKKGVPPKKISILPNWVDIELYQNLTQNISFRQRWSLEDKFIFLFAGVIGPAQGMEFVVEIARRVVDISAITFLLVGDGTEKQKIENLINQYRLQNIILKSFISKDEYPYLVRDADVGLLCLSPSNKTPFMPGKFTGYMASGKPVLAFLHKESSGFGLVEQARCGYASSSGDLEAAVRLTRRMYVDKGQIADLGANGLEYAKKYLSLEACLETMERLFGS